MIWGIHKVLKNINLKSANDNINMKNQSIFLQNTLKLLLINTSSN